VRFRRSRRLDVVAVKHSEFDADQERREGHLAASEEVAVAVERYRLVTRSDFDGLVCAVLLQQLGLVEDILFVHPKDVQDGQVDIGPGDIATNLPYAPDAHLVFDHHHSETLRNTTIAPNHVIDPDAPSAARVVYDYYGGAERFPSVSPDLMRAVDQADSAQYSLQEVLAPTGWVLLNFLMDSRTGLGRFRDFRISNYQLMMQLIDACQRHSIEKILELPDVKERVELYHQQAEAFVAQLRRCSSVRGSVVVVDLRAEEVIHAGNRFMVYALFPHSTVSIHVLWGKQRQNTVLAVGKSILNRTSGADIGALMLSYGGGGHANAGTCQVPHNQADGVVEELVGHLNAANPARV
jgi:nanoRNase/pAp phosphatase (c-di-AMP/oligoRNAs hydrolase)